jgi:hypothetical protein
MMRRPAVAIGIVVLGASFGLAAPVGASSVTKPVRVRNGGVSSTLGAGYLQTPPSGTGVTVAETELRVPKITKCASKTDTEELWLGAAGYEGTAGGGAEDLYAQVLVECVNGAISYTAWGSAPGAATQSAAVAPGDVIDMYFRDSSSGSVVQIFKIQKPIDAELVDIVGNPPTNGTGSLGSVLLGQQDLSSHIPKFVDIKTSKSKVYFMHAYVNGYVLGFDTYPTMELNQANNNVELVTSALHGASLNDFHLSFHSHY